LVISSFAFLHSTLGWIGGSLAFVAFFWSLAVLIAGMRNVHQITVGRSIAVLVVTFLVFVFLIPVFSVSLISIVMMVVL
jgi:Ca2+/Na+ antiporter